MKISSRYHVTKRGIKKRNPRKRNYITKIEREILELEIESRKLFRRYNPLPNNKERARLWRKDMQISQKQRRLLYGPDGFIKPKLKNIVYKKGPKKGQLKINLLKR